MRFFTLLKKELRECMAPFTIIGLIWLCVTGMHLHLISTNSLLDYSTFIQHALEPDQPVNEHALYNTLAADEEIGAWLLCISGLLGLSLALVQFWMPLWSKAWGFLIHRACSRGLILTSKLMCAFLMFTLAIGLPWTLFVQVLDRLKDTGIPGNPRIVYEGWLYILLGFGLYLGTALSALRRERWYTTRLFSMVASVILLLATVFWINLYLSFVLLGIGLAMFVILLSQTFSQREF
jgi:hypothetical protein